MLLMRGGGENRTARSGCATGEPMSAKIEVDKVDASHFRVRVIEAGNESTHQVSLDP